MRAAASTFLDVGRVPSTLDLEDAKTSSTEAAFCHVLVVSWEVFFP